MKLKTKDEITIKLVDKLEKYRMTTVIGDEDQAFMILGEINMLKWVLSISENIKNEELPDNKQW